MKNFGFAPVELRQLRSLRTPLLIQRHLESLPYHHANTAWSPRRVLQEGTAHCLEGAIFAAAALRVNGYEPLLLDFEAVRDTDHVLAIYRVNGGWGAIGKSNFAFLRFRDPVYRSLRELAMSYFDGYCNLRGERTLRAFSRPVNLKRFDHLRMDDDGKACLVHPRTSVPRSAHAAALAFSGKGAHPPRSALLSRWSHGTSAALRVACCFRVVPSAQVVRQQIRLRRSPRTRFIRIHRGYVSQNRLDDRPCGFHCILPDEQQLIAMHGIRQQTLVRFILVTASSRSPPRVPLPWSRPNSACSCPDISLARPGSATDPGPSRNRK